MAKKKIRIYALHPNILSVEGITFFPYISDKYDFIWDETNPEYVVATEAIYYYESYGEKFKNFLKNKEIIIIGDHGECIIPDMNLFDYACVFDRDMSFNDRIMRMPTLMRFRMHMVSDIPEKKLIKKSKFCNFMYSNPHANENRDLLFYRLSEYKRVDSLGPHLNNVGNQTTRETVDWRYRSIVERLPYKFSIAAENALKIGYVSEKILCCMQADTVPVFWGDPTIGREFNEKRFINCHKYRSFDEVLDVVKKIDNDDRLWEEMISQPIQTPEQVQRSELEAQNYIKFLCHIFDQDLKQAKRRDDGYHPNLYRKWLFRENDNCFVSAREQKLRSVNEIYKRLLQLKHNGWTLEKILQKKGWQSIAVYAMGDIGKLIYDELENSGVRVVYAINRSKVSYKDLKIVSLKDGLKKVDQIVVSLPDEYDAIAEAIRQVSDIETVNIRTLLTEGQI